MSLDQVDSPVASFTADGAYDWDSIYDEVAARHPEAAVIVPPRSNAVLSNTAETAPTQRDRHLRSIEEQGRMAWQAASGYNWRALVEADVSRLASWWHTDADLGRPMEVVTDMSKSREAGFLGYRRTERSFTDLFDRYRAEGLIPTPAA